MLPAQAEADTAGFATDDVDPATVTVNEETTPEVDEAQPDTGVQAQAASLSASQIASALIDLEREVARFHARAEAQETLIAKMHARIEVLQSGETKKLLKPVSTQLITLFSDIGGAAWSLTPETSVDQFRGLLTNFSLVVEQILDNLGLSSLDTAPGDEFDPRLHHAIKKVDTEDPTLNRKIVEVLRQGFIEAGEAKPLVPSRVSVYRTTAPATSSTPTPEPGAH